MNDLLKNFCALMLIILIFVSYCVVAYYGYLYGRADFHKELIDGMRDYNEAAIMYRKNGELRLLTSSDEPTGEL